METFCCGNGIMVEMQRVAECLAMHWVLLRFWNPKILTLEKKKRNMVINNVCFNLLVFLVSPLYFILV